MKAIEEWMVAGAYNPGHSLFTGPMLVKDGEWLMGMQNCQSAVHLWTVLSYAVITGREKLFPDFTSGYQYMRISFMNHAVLWRMTRRCPTTQLISRDWILTGSLRSHSGGFSATSLTPISLHTQVTWTSDCYMSRDPTAPLKRLLLGWTDS